MLYILSKQDANMLRLTVTRLIKSRGLIFAWVQKAFRVKITWKNVSHSCLKVSILLNQCIGLILFFR